MKKYYLIETNYVGPYRDELIDDDKIEIRTSPAITNQSHMVLTDGWCGITNDRSVWAHGEYDTTEEARAAIAAEFGEVRSTDANGDSFESDDESVVETYKPGKYAPMSSKVAEDWAYEIQSNINGETTDADISALLVEFEADANLEGYTLDSTMEGLMQERRDELRDEMEDDDAP